jgi:hypothetical protein
MPKFSMTVPHNLPQDEATERLKRLLDFVKDAYKDKYKDLQETWGDNSLTSSFKTLGFTIKGKVDVETNQIKIDSDLPFAAMMFKGQIEKTLREQITKILA